MSDPNLPLLRTQAFRDDAFLPDMVKDNLVQQSSQPSQPNQTEQALQAELNRLNQQNQALQNEVYQKDYLTRTLIDQSQASGQNFNVAVQQNNYLAHENQQLQQRSKLAKYLLIIGIVYSIICIFLFGFSTETAGWIAWTGLAASFIALIVVSFLGWWFKKR